MLQTVFYFSDPECKYGSECEEIGNFHVSMWIYVWI